jgi:hypothetical protein
VPWCGEGLIKSAVSTVLVEDVFLALKKLYSANQRNGGVVLLETHQGGIDASLIISERELSRLSHVELTCSCSQYHIIKISDFVLDPDI